MAKTRKSGNPAVRAGVNSSTTVGGKSKGAQTIGLFGAVAIGLASMLGAGVFVVFHSAYLIAVGGLFWALALAALVACLNSWSIYSMARKLDRPGGVYSYAREYLNPTSSFLAGFAFVFGKIGSIAAIALAFNLYLAPGVGFVPAAVAIVILTLINISGIQRTALMSAILAVLTGGYLLILTIAGFNTPAYTALTSFDPTQGLSFQGIFGAAAIFFFAFAGYARVATLGNEVSKPKQNIPRAIVISLGLVIALYFALALVLVKFEGTTLGIIAAPIGELASLVFGGVGTLGTWVTFIAALACLGSMLALLAGVSRTSAVMAQDRELPKFFEVRNRKGVPYRAEIAIAAGAIALTVIGDVTWVIGFSSFSVLFYYAVGHLTVLRQPKKDRVIPKWAAWLGFGLCALLAAAIPGPAVPVSTAILVIAFLLRRFVSARAAKKAVAEQQDIYLGEQD